MLPAREPPGPLGGRGLPGRRAPQAHPDQPDLQGPRAHPSSWMRPPSRLFIEQIQEQLDTGYATATVPPKSTPADYTKFLVRDAISRYESEGLDATVAYYNTKGEC